MKNDIYMKRGDAFMDPSYGYTTTAKYDKPLVM